METTFIAAKFGQVFADLYNIITEKCYIATRMPCEHENTHLLKVMASVNTYVNTFRFNVLSSDEFIWIFIFPKHSISVFCVNSEHLL